MREVPSIVKRMRSLLLANQAFSAACVFESHLTTHPVIRLNPEALELAVQIYAELNRMEHAHDIVDFVEEYQIKAPEVINALLRVFIRRGDVAKAESLVARMKQTHCAITSELYVKLAQLFAMNDREESIKEILQEVQMWFPDEAYRAQAVLIRYYFANERMAEAQAMMRDMYTAGIPFHPSIFSALLETRLRSGFPDAILQTLEEMKTLGVIPNAEFSKSVIRALLKSHNSHVALNFIMALKRDNHFRNAYLYHLVMQYHLERHDHWSNVRVYKALHSDRKAPLTPHSFLRIVPSLADISYSLNSIQEPSEKTQAHADYKQALSMVLEDLLTSGVDPESMSVGYMIDLLARESPQDALQLALHSFSQLKSGAWKRSVGAINATAYGLYHYGSLDQQCTFVDYVIENQVIPPAYVIAIILRQLKIEAENNPLPGTFSGTSRFDLTNFVSLLEKHAFHLELPLYIVDRFASALLERGLDTDAARMFASAMQSLNPIDHNNFNMYQTFASWRQTEPRDNALEDDVDLGSLRSPAHDTDKNLDLDDTQRYSRQYESRTRDYKLPEEQEPEETPSPNESQ